MGFCEPIFSKLEFVFGRGGNMTAGFRTEYEDLTVGEGELSTSYKYDPASKTRKFNYDDDEEEEMSFGIKAMN